MANRKSAERCFDETVAAWEGADGGVGADGVEVLPQNVLMCACAVVGCFGLSSQDKPTYTTTYSGGKKTGGGAYGGYAAGSTGAWASPSKQVCRRNTPEQ